MPGKSRNHINIQGLQPFLVETHLLKRKVLALVLVVGVSAGFLQTCGLFNAYEGQLIFTEASREKGYNFPYFLFIPDGVAEGDEAVLVVEPNNSGFVHDELEKHVEKAERTATREYYVGNATARALQFPLLVPIFPHPEPSSIDLP